MKFSVTKILACLAMAAAMTAMVKIADADPLPGQIMKFDQSPMIATTVAAAGQAKSTSVTMS